MDACRQKMSNSVYGLHDALPCVSSGSLAPDSGGQAGKPVLAAPSFPCWYPAMKVRRQHLELSGGSLIDMGSHCIDLLKCSLQSENSPASLAIWCRIIPAKTRRCCLNLKMEPKALLIAVSIFRMSAREIVWNSTVRRSILAEGTIGQGDAGKMTSCLQETDAEYEAQQTRQDGGGKAIELQPVNTYRAEVEAFYRLF